MEAFLALAAAMIKPLLLCLLALAAVAGAMGAVSPRALRLTAAAGNRWIDTWRFFHVSEENPLRRLDTWIDTDGAFLRHARSIGLVIAVGALLLGYWCVRSL